ncbi:MAG: insulinase family protein [Eubacterium sp.]|nr:insulinase family protein [Eubacterium sp.]MBR0412816.1 insulinase family protein [Eubacterium sp.]
MKEFTQINIGAGIDIVYAKTDKFKTNEIAVSLLTPLCEDTVSANALLFNLISRTTKAYPTVNEFNRRLAALYGAKVNCSVGKLGENQSLTIMMSSLADRFAIDGESIGADCFDLIADMLFAPNTDENGHFFESDIKREKKLLCEKLDAEYSEKRIYSLRKLEALMFEGEPYAINKYGTKDSINALDGKALTSAYNTLLKSAKIQITVVGNVDIDYITARAAACFATVSREYQPPVKAVFKPFPEMIKDEREAIDVEQGKLVIGYRVNCEDNFAGRPDVRLFCDVFGGGPYSKLFTNVREKMSLCYYCSARYDRRKSCVIIQCGCEEENMNKAVDEINHQLESVQNGDIEEEFTAAKMGVSDLIMSVRDDSVSLCMWYSSQITDAEILSPEASAECNNSVTFDEIVSSAKLLKLDSVFRLVPSKEGE